jgi:hypothetical protein
MLNLEPIKERLAAADEGPWSDFCESGDWWIQQCSADGDPIGATICDANDMSTSNMNLIAHAPADLAALIEEVVKLRMALDTIGTTIYTQGRGTQAEQRLLAFIREQLGRT